MSKGWHLVAAAAGVLVLTPITAGGRTQEPAQAQRQALLREGVAARSQGQLERALAIFRRGLERRDDDAALWFELGVTQLWRGALPEARSAMRQAVALDPTHLGARATAARLDGWRGDLQGAADAFDAILAEMPGQIDALLGRAWVHRHQLELRAARVLYRRVLSMRPEHAEALDGLSQVAATTRHRIRLGSAVVHDTATGGSLDASIDWDWRASRTVRLRAGYTYRGATIVTEVPAAERTHRVRVGGALQLAPRLVIEADYQLRLDERWGRHGLALGLAVPCGESVALLAGASASLAAAGPDAAGRAGVQVNVGDVQLMGAAHLAREHGGTVTVAAVAAASWALSGSWQIRGSGSLTWLAAGEVVPGAELGLAWSSRRFGVVVRGSWSAAPLARASIGVVLEARL